MPGKKITDHQVLKYKEYRNKMSQVAAAAKTPSASAVRAGLRAVKLYPRRVRRVTGARGRTRWQGFGTPRSCRCYGPTQR